jgi:hypothetical protein
MFLFSFSHNLVRKFVGAASFCWSLRRYAAPALPAPQIMFCLARYLKKMGKNFCFAALSQNPLRILIIFYAAMGWINRYLMIALTSLLPVTSCIVDSAAIHIMVVKFRKTICPPPLQLLLHRRASLSTNSNGTQSVYSRNHPKNSL